MLRRHGRIVTLERQRAIVEVAAAGGGCARCASGRGCGLGFGRAAGGDKRLLSLPLPPGLRLRVGDTVELGVEDAGLLGATLLAYGVPLASLALAVLVASALGLGDAAAASLALASLALAVVLARRLAVSSGAAARCRPRLLGAAARTADA